MNVLIGITILFTLLLVAGRRDIEKRQLERKRERELKRKIERLIESIEGLY